MNPKHSTWILALCVAALPVSLVEARQCVEPPPPPPVDTSPPPPPQDTTTNQNDKVNTQGKLPGPGGKYIPNDGVGGPGSGQYGPPPVTPGGKGGGITGTGGGGGSPASGGSVGSGGGARPGAAPGSAGARGGVGGGGAFTGKKARTTVSLDRWDLWWELNQEAFLLARSPTASPTTRRRGFLDGYGMTMEVPVDRKPPVAVLLQDVYPALREALRDSDPKVRSAAALALGRVGVKEMSSELIADLQTALADVDAEVRTSALLAIGAFGDRNSTRALWAVMNDTRQGRDMLAATGAIQNRDRALAAFALGLSDGGDVASQCRRLLSKSVTQDVEISGSAVLALGLVGQNDPELVPFLGSMLTDARLDRRVRAQVPLALARIGQSAVSMIPYLLQYAKDPREEGLLRESSVLAMGRLGGTYDTEVLATLRDLVRTDSDSSVRHYALLALAQIASRGEGATAADVVSGVGRFLEQQIDRPRYGIDLPWAALAAGILAGALPSDSPTRVDLSDVLFTEFRKAANPSDEGALAIALGLGSVVSAGEELLARFHKRGDEGTRSHISTALGLLRVQSAIPTLREALLDDAKPALRVAAARALELLGERSDADPLMTRLEGEVSAADARSLALAVARLRDPSVALRLARVVRDPQSDSAVRSACCEALGILAERGEIPFHSELTRDLNVHIGLNAPSEVIERL